MEQNLSQEEIFRLMVDAIQDYAIFLLDPKGVIITWNPGAERIKGYKPGEIIGKHFSAFYPPEDIASGKPRKELEWAVQYGYYKEEGWRLRKDGSKFWALVVITALKLPDGELKGFSKVTRDITDKKEFQQLLEARVEERNRQLLEINKELEQFAYTASHDLQEPLRTVSMYADLLLLRAKDKLSIEEKEFLRYAIEGSERAQTLIKSLLEYARIGVQTKEFKKTEMDGVLKKALFNLRLAVQESGTEVSADPLPIIIADSFQMLQLLQNLISNAVKYKNDRPLKIHVSAKERDHEWVFSVRDTGIGIGPEYQEKIFGLFQRVHRDKKYAGTGIGLALCKKIVQRHHGRIWFESEVNKGTVFFFTIPKMTMTAPPAGESLLPS